MIRVVSGRLLCFALVALLFSPATVQAEEGKKVSELILGQWGIDRAKMIQSMKKTLKDDEERLESMLEMVEEMATQLVIEFTAKGEVNAYSSYENDNSKFMLSKVTEKSGEFTLEIVREGREPVVMSGAISSDGLMIKMPEPGEMHLRRLKKNEAAKMIEAIEKSQAEKRAQQDAPEIKVRPKQ